MSEILNSYLAGAGADINCVMIYGRNKYSECLSALLQIEAYVDDYTTDEDFLGRPVIKLKDVPKHAFVINCSYSMYPVSVEKRLNLLEINHVNISELLCQGIVTKDDDFFQVAIEDMQRNAEQYSFIRNLLEDDESRQVWDNLMSYRKTGNLNFMKEFVVDQEGQYFADFVTLKGDTFADLGAFDGATTEIFIQKCPDYQGIHLFEPAQSNMDAAKRRLDGYPGISYHQLGVSDVKEQLTFSSSAGSACKVSAQGDETIYLDSLDNISQDAISFIKIDIEGFERKALLGAKNHIRKSHPLMAVAVYHFPNDVWQIPQLIFSIRDDYSIRLRHYTEGTDETIMYFLPKKEHQ